MVAAEWMVYLELVFLSIKPYEYSPKIVPAALKHINVLHTDISILQSWLRRSLSTTQKIHYVNRFLRQHPSTDADKELDAALIEDYEEIASLIQTYTHRIEMTISVATSLIQAIDCRRSLTETEDISRLTYLALGFIPLSFVSGLFSMNERIAPGGEYFWVYFVVAIPLCLIIFMVIRLRSFMIQAALDKARAFRKKQSSIA